MRINLRKIITLRGIFLTVMVFAAMITPFLLKNRDQSVVKRLQPTITGIQGERNTAQAQTTAVAGQLTEEQARHETQVATLKATVKDRDATIVSISQTASPTSVTPNPPAPQGINFDGICLTDNPQQVTPNTSTTWVPIDGTPWLPEFLRPWCTEGIKGYYKTSGEGGGVRVEFTPNQKDRINQNDVILYLMIMAQEPHDSINVISGISSTTAVAQVEFGEGMDSTDLKLGSNIGLWNQHLDNEISQNEPSYLRIWSGYSGDNKVAHQMLVTSIPLNRGVNGFTITDTHPQVDLMIVGAMFGPKLGDQNARLKYQPVCNRNGSETNDMIRVFESNSSGVSSILLSSIVQIQKEETSNPELRDLAMTGCIMIKPVLPLDFYLLPSDQTGRDVAPLVFWDKVVQTRPLDPAQDGFGKPELSLNFTTPVTNVQRVHLMVGARNLCNPAWIGGNASPTYELIAKIKVTYQDGTTKESDLAPTKDNIRQGRSGIRTCDYPSGVGGSRDMRDFHDPRVPGLLPTPSHTVGTITTSPGTVLLSQETPETGGEAVGLWVDITSISVDPNRPIKSITLTDNSEPKPTEHNDHNDSVDSVDYSDPYLILYGAALELAD